MYLCPVLHCHTVTDLYEPLCRVHRGLLPVGLLYYLYRTWDDGLGASNPKRWRAILRAKAAAELAEAA